MHEVNIQAGDRLNLGSTTYHIRQQLGEGGFSQVFLATANNQPVALKLGQLWKVPERGRLHMLQRFLQEYRISRQYLSVPGIVRVMHYYELEENPILVMDYLPGGILDVHKPYPEPQVHGLVQQLVAILEKVHQKNIIHRDLKPENILWKGRQLHLADFGVATLLNERLTQLNTLGHARQVFSSLAYSPPEQVSSALAFHTASPASDLFSLGVIVYQLFTGGQLPFGNPDSEHAGFYPIRKQRGEWNRELLLARLNNYTWFEIIEHCLQAHPHRRLQQAGQVNQLLNGTFERNARQAFFSNRWQLQIREGHNAGAVYRLSELNRENKQNRLLLGREAPDHANDLVLIETGLALISTRHATLEVIFNETGQEQWYIRNGQPVHSGSGWQLSRNGLTVNGTPVSRQRLPLFHGDEISIGSFLLTVQVK